MAGKSIPDRMIIHLLYSQLREYSITNLPIYIFMDSGKIIHNSGSNQDLCSCGCNVAVTRLVNMHPCSVPDFHHKPTCNKTWHFLQACGVLNAIACGTHLALNLGEGQQVAVIVPKSVVDTHEASIVGEVAEFLSQPIIRTIQLTCVQVWRQSVDLVSHSRHTSKHVGAVSGAAGGRRAEHGEAAVGARGQARVICRNLSKMLEKWKKRKRYLRMINLSLVPQNQLHYNSCNSTS